MRPFSFQIEKSLVCIPTDIQLIGMLQFGATLFEQIDQHAVDYGSTGLVLYAGASKLITA
jgi:hypothetical protein